MSLLSVVLLTLAGLAAGFIAGLVGVGGGVIFAPVLFFYFSWIGVSPDVVAQLTLGSSLFCTLIASMTGAHVHYRSGVVDVRIALMVGFMSAIAVFLTTRFVTTRPWYDGAVFQAVFSFVLLGVILQMLRPGGKDDASHREGRHSYLKLFATGSAAGAVSSAAGVGGGVVLVPAYHQLLRIPMRRSVGTSSATVVLIALAGVINYATVGWSSDTPPLTVGYVAFGHSAVLAGASVVSARFGARLAQRVSSRILRISFAAIGLVVAFRLLYEALSGAA